VELAKQLHAGIQGADEFPLHPDDRALVANLEDLIMEFIMVNDSDPLDK
jgi:hypothetical protein